MCVTGFTSWPKKLICVLPLISSKNICLLLSQFLCNKLSPFFEGFNRHKQCHIASCSLSLVSQFPRRSWSRQLKIIQYKTQGHMSIESKFQLPRLYTSQKVNEKPFLMTVAPHSVERLKQLCAQRDLTFSMIYFFQFINILLFTLN